MNGYDVEVGERLVIDGVRVTVTKFKRRGHVAYNYDQPHEYTDTQHIWDSWVDLVHGGHVTEPQADTTRRRFSFDEND